MFPDLRQFSFISVLLRMLLAVIVGGSIGLERERKKRGAGFRTYMIVALGASLTVILSEYLNAMLMGPWSGTAEFVGIRTDVSRFGAQVINGVGFLGAGTIIVTANQEVKGLTTAAGLWASACIGLAVGAGFYECVLICFVLVLIIMRFLPAVETFFHQRSLYMNISLDLDSLDCLGSIVSLLKGEGVHIYGIETGKDSGERFNSGKTLISIHLPGHRNHEELLAMISAIDGVIAIDEI